ncbi:hypothetical protein EDB83DRAFT_2524735 [Lactarius deliciosus]|nr:hypothetical protein EDB83DRAFT_2524735 [Lactarius deliciosus]
MALQRLGSVWAETGFETSPDREIGPDVVVHYGTSVLTASLLLLALGLSETLYPAFFYADTIECILAYPGRISIAIIVIFNLYPCLCQHPPQLNMRTDNTKLPPLGRIGLLSRTPRRIFVKSIYMTRPSTTYRPLEIVQNDEESDDNSENGEPLFEVLSVDEKKRDSRPSKLPEAMPPPPTLLPSTGNAQVPQCRYQLNAEDQRLMTELLSWLLDELADRLNPRHVEAGAFGEHGYPDPESPLAVLEITAKRATGFSLPLQEVDILVDNKAVEPGVLDQGSHVIAI